ncbi:hypothetical protein OS493_008495 [Desmophyllum pertusum]|uniref:Uncharacterized protein n=1 Tax=Desmophyllum pertusum TaxID=174260 RepID=A0A9W9ZRF7_9CNID|nr:hypothetical protein OS493_008495 [Desmophyllum pertusum]
MEPDDKLSRGSDDAHTGLNRVSMEKLKMGFTRRRSIACSNVSSASSSETSSCSSSSSGDSSPVFVENGLSEIETRIIDMADIAKRRRQRSKSVPHVRRFHCTSVDETFDFIFSSKVDASSFQELPTTTLCSTEL